MKVIGVMDKVGTVADVAGLAWDVGSAMLSVPGGEGGSGDMSGLDLFGPDGSDEGECFIAGTAVLTGAADATGQFSTKRIEDVRVGDLVLSRSEADPAAPLQLRAVTRLFRNVAYSIQRVTLLLAEGGTELLQVTAGHSFWVEGQGWTPAELLLAGQTVLTADGQAATVVDSESVAHPAGIIVYNFSVEGDRTYFVDDGLGDIAAVWVHNAKRPRVRVAPVKYGESTLSLQALAHRIENRKSLHPGQNIAAFQVGDDIRVFRSIPGKLHAEEVGLNSLTAAEKARVTRVFSELKPCDLERINCMGRLKRELSNLSEITYSFRSNASKKRWLSDFFKDWT